MKKLIGYVMLSVVISPLFSQTFPLEPFISIALQKGDFPLFFSAGPYDGRAPRDITFIDGRSLFIAQVRNGIIFDIYQKKAVASLEFPRPDNDATFKNGYFFTFAENSFVSRKIAPTLSQYDGANYVVSNFQTKDEAKLLFTKPYYLQEMYFFYGRDEKLIGLTTEGQLVSTQEVIAKQLEWQRNTWYPSAKKRDKHKRLIETGKYLIVDGIFYPSNLMQAGDYFIYMGINWNINPLLNQGRSEMSTRSSSGVAVNGDIYIPLEKSMNVYNQEGEQLVSIDTKDKEQWYKVPEDKKETVGAMLYAVHPNGDLYALQSMQYDSNYFYRTLKTWGTDLVKMAREGVTSGNLEATKKVVQNLSNQELKLLRNTFFALQGYVFTTWELKNYFLGYEWYQPNPTVTSNTSGFTSEQKKLFDLVVMEESRRQAEVAKMNSGVSN